MIGSETESQGERIEKRLHLDSCGYHTTLFYILYILYYESG